MVRSQHILYLTIGKLAASANVGVETIRFYQRKGLLDTPPRYRGVRRYGEADLRRLHFIRQAQTAGFTLEEIRELLSLDAGQDRATAKKMAESRLEALDGKIKQLELARAALQKLVSACAQEKPGPCPILKSFDF